MTTRLFTNTLSLSTLLAAALAVGACGDEPDQTRLGEEIEDIGQDFGSDEGDVIEETAEAIDAMGDAITNKDRRTFADKADEAVDDLGRWIDQETAELGSVRADLREDRRQALAEARADLSRIEQELDQLGDSAESEWEQASSKIQAEMSDLRDALRAD